MFKKSMMMAALALATLVPAHASYFTHYVITLTGPLAVDGIVKFEKDAGGGGMSWPDFLTGGSVNYINQVFGSDTPRTSGFFLGMSYDGYTQPQFFDQNDLASLTGKHVVAFMSNSAANAAIGQEFSDFFGVSEDDVITWLEAVGQIGTPPLDSGLFDTYANNLSTLADNANLNHNAFFAIPGSQSAFSGQFSVVQFSQGTLVGTGEVTQENSAPEPGSLVLFGLGLSAFGIRRILKVLPWGARS